MAIERRRRAAPVNRREPAIKVAAMRVGKIERHWAPRTAQESWDHAFGVWEAVRRAVVGRAPALEAQVGRAGRAALEGQVDLVLVTLVAAHLSHCGECWRKWTDGHRPGDLLTAAVRRRPAGEILRAVELENRARRRAGGRR